LDWSHIFRLVVLCEFVPYLYWFLSRLLLSISRAVPVNCIGGLVDLGLVWMGSESRIFRDSNPVKVVPLHTMKSYMGRRGVAPLIHIVGTRWRYRGRVSIYIRYVFDLGNEFSNCPELYRKLVTLHSLEFNLR